MLMRLGPRPEAFQLPLVIDQARESGRAQYIGRGLNRWSTVHIADVVDLYLLALKKAPAGTFVFVKVEKPHSAIWRRLSPTRWR